MEYKNTKEEKNSKVLRNYVGLRIALITLLIIMAMLVIVLIGINAQYSGTQEIAHALEETTPENINALESSDVGTSVTATFDSSTGLVTISSTPEIPETPGTINKQELRNFFETCGYENIIEIRFTNDINAPTDLSGLFEGLYELQDIYDPNYIDTTAVTNMSRMFYGCTNLGSIDLSSWNMSSVNDTTDMFTGCIFLRQVHTPSQYSSQTIKLPATFYNEADDTGVVEAGASAIGGAKAAFEEGTGELKISNRFTHTYSEFNNTTFQESVKLKLGTIDSEALNTLYEEHGRESIRKITFVDHVYAPISSASLFENLTQLTTVNNAQNLDVSNSERMYKWFSGCTNLSTIDVKDWKTLKVKDMSYLFNGCTSLTQVDVSSWNTGKCEKMDFMFSGCSTLTTINVADWTMDNVTIIHDMFSGCTNLATIDVSKWKTDNVTDMGSAFKECENLQSPVNIENWNTEKVQDMSYMFAECKKLTTLDVSRWQTGSVTNINRIFMNCEKLTPIEVGSWDMSKAQNMDAMFYGCTSITELDVSRWNTESATSMYALFYDCNKITTFDVSDWNTANVTSMKIMFEHCTSLQTLDVSGWQTGNVKSMYAMFRDCDVLPTLEVSEWDTGSVTDMHAMFSSCEKLTTLDVSGWNTENVTDMGSMFYTCKLLPEIDVTNWKTGNVKDMSKMFQNCTVDTIDVSQWDTSKVENMKEMFKSCSNVTPLAVSNWNTQNVTDISGMFYRCTSVTELDLSKWHTEKITTMNSTFYGCSKLDTLNVKNWNTEQVTDMGQMFNKCSVLRKLDLSSFDFSNIETYENCLTECKKLNEIWLPIYTSNNSITLPDDKYRDTDEPENASIYYDDINNTEFTEPRHLFRGVFISFDLDMAEDYILPEHSSHTQTQWSIVEEESNSGGTEGHGKDILPITTNNYSESITNASILWDEETLESEVGYKFVGWNSNHDEELIGVPYTSSEFEEDITYTASFEVTGVKYTVKHWKQKLGAGTSTENPEEDYELAKTDNKAGTTGESVTPPVMEYDGFVLPDTQTVVISGDGTTEVNYFYIRRTDLSYTVKYIDNEDQTDIETPKTVTGQTFESEITTSNEVKPIDGYKHVRTEPEDTLTISTQEDQNIIKVFYDKEGVIDLTPALEGNMEVTATANEEDEDGIPVLTQERGEVTYDIKYTIDIDDYKGDAQVEIEVKLPAGIDLEKSEIGDGVYDETNHTIKWVETIEDIDTFTEGETFEKEIEKQIKVVYEDQNVIEDLVTDVNGKITTYYPEDYLDKGGEKLAEKESQDTITVKQDHKVNFKVIKIWDDNNNIKGNRPESVTIEITIMPNEQTITKILNEENYWTYEEANLPKYNATTGERVQYTVTERETKEGDLKYYEEANIQKAETQTNEQTNYTYTITNSYKVGETEFNTKITKVGPNEITSVDEKINYTINFTSEISNYIGGGKVTIVDTLPYHINKENSELAGGKYDEQTKTITWVEELPHINTDTLGESYKLNIVKEIVVLYKDIDLTQEKMTNEVTGTIELDSSDKKDAKSTGVDTNINLKEFDFAIEKTLTGVTLNGQAVDIKDNKLAKVELKSKEVSKTDIIVSYSIKVINKGDLAGTVKVVDKVPDGFEFVTVPEYWTQNNDGTLQTNVELDVGQSKELNLTLKWINKEENLGIKSNRAELIGGESVANYNDENKENDISEATVVISIKTGWEVSTILIITVIISMIITSYIVIIIIRTYGKETNINTIRFLNK